jgi:hypothetical protein
VGAASKVFLEPAMNPITEIREQTAALTVDLLISDAQLTVTFLDLAELSPNTDEGRERCFQQASQAHDIIVKLVPHLTLTEEQKEALMKRLTVLRGRLDRYVARFRKVA